MESLRLCCLGSVLLAILSILSLLGQAAELQDLHHNLKIVLFPKEQRLSGIDTVTGLREHAGALVFALAKSAAVQSAAVNEENRPFTLQDGKIRVPVTAHDSFASRLTVRYTVSFAEQVPETPANTDNPGYGVVGVISEKGTFLQAGSGWYPEIPGSPATYTPSVEAPAVILAVSAGRSLGHQVAHCWWGNGVLVDAHGGNWCEGLTTYLADYLYKERASEAEAREYRLQILRNFTMLVTPERDFPLNIFRSRNNPVSQAIGYGKAAMVFHMLRRKLGEVPFWGGATGHLSGKAFSKR